MILIPSKIVLCPDEIVMIFKLDFYRLGIGPGTDDEKNTEEEVRFIFCGI